MSTTPGDEIAPREGDTAPGTDPDELVRTGDPAIDEALAGLDTLEDRAVEEHPAVFEHVHRALRDALSGTRASPHGTAGP